MPVNFRRAMGVKMKLIGALSRSGVVAPAIATTWQTELTETIIAQRFDAGHTQIETAQIRYHGQEIDNRFRHDPGN